MRTLVQVVIRPEHRESAEETIKRWLQDSGFRPEAISLDDDARASILTAEEPNIIVSPVASDSLSEIARGHAIEILCTVPLIDRERHLALHYARLVIHFEDHVHGTTVWGIVCIDSPSITIRWRHRVSRSLERATEELVQKIWKNSGQEHLFEPFTHGHSIPVREPHSTTDAYLGEILPPGGRLRERAKRDKKSELRVARWAVIVTVACFLIGLILYLFSDPNSFLRWVSGAFDRLATTGAATAMVSYLSYLFHLQELSRKPVIDWK